MRINRFFTDNGICSRREADKYVEDGRIRINERVAVHGDKIGAGDKVYLDNKLISSKKSRDIVIAFNKPVGVECTSDPEVTDNIIAAVNYPERLFHIGRLDKMSEGLILLTNIGNLVNATLRKSEKQEKEYHVWLNDEISAKQIQMLREGILIDDRKTLPCKVRPMGERKIGMTLVEGRNRQIRKMIEALDIRVSRLMRVRFINVKLLDLEPGRWREVEGDELQELIKRAKLEGTQASTQVSLTSTQVSLTSTLASTQVTKTTKK